MSIDKIEHVVLLMMENRSFDSLLGWLYEKKQPAKNIPPLKPGEPAFDGRNVAGAQDYVNADPASGFKGVPSYGAHGLGVPNIAPGESFAEVNMQLFEKENPGPNDRPTMKGYVHDYANVLRKHGYTTEEIKACAGQVLQCYLPVQLPVLNGLAEHYAVCDRWFSSVPSQTNPNRAFALCGTSMGLVDNGFLEEDPRREKIEQLVHYKLGDDRFKTKTIFNALEESHKLEEGHKKSWGVFGGSALLQNKIAVAIEALKGMRDMTPGLRALWEKVQDMLGWEALEYLKDCSTPYDVSSDYTYRLFPEIARIKSVGSHFGTISDFHSAARAGQLPHFSYIEPDWTIAETGTGSTWMNRGAEQLLKILLFHQGNDYHPPGNLDAGENLVRQVYESLIANRRAWEKTLLLITFDEPVGSFDHVQPPEALAPWTTIQVQTYQDGTKRVLPKGKMGKTNVPGTAAADGAAGGFVLQHNFEFNRYGGRVPTIVVSPLVEKGTVFRSETKTPFDHTSIIATVLKWRRISSQDFGGRAANAPTFDSAVTLTTPRTDEREVRFLKFGRMVGDPVHFYDRFYLRDSSGRYISGFKEDPVSGFSILGEDPTFTEYFPRMAASPTFPFYFQSVHYRPWDDPIPADGVTQVRLVTTDPGVGAYNVLGQWQDANGYCYYYNDYVSGRNGDKETWILEKGDKSILRFGDQVAIANKFDNKSKLARTADWGTNPNYLTTQIPTEYWTIEPVPDGPNGFRFVLGNRGAQYLALTVRNDGHPDRYEYADLFYYLPGGGYAGLGISREDGTFEPTPLCSQGRPVEPARTGFVNDLSSPEDHFLALDVNGDGRSDLFYYGRGFAGLYISKGDGTFTHHALCHQGKPVDPARTGFVNDLSSPEDHFLALDVNGDGRSDLFYYGRGFAGLYISKGDGTFTHHALCHQGKPVDPARTGFVNDLSSPEDHFLALDVNGDGRSDLFYYGRGFAGLYISKGDGTFTHHALCHQGKPVDPARTGFVNDLSSPEDHFLTLDVNRDGKSDLFYYCTRGADRGFAGLYISKGDGTFRHQPLCSQGRPVEPARTGFVNDLSSPEDHFLAFDVSGSRRSSDLFYYGRGFAGLYVSKGDGTFVHHSLCVQGRPVHRTGFVNDLSSPEDHFLALDVNGDGKSDLFYYGRGFAGLYISKGDGTFTHKRLLS